MVILLHLTRLQLPWVANIEKGGYADHLATMNALYTETWCNGGSFDNQITGEAADRRPSTPPLVYSLHGQSIV